MGRTEIGLGFIVLVIVVGGLAWLLHFTGLTDEQWHGFILAKVCAARHYYSGSFSACDKEIKEMDRNRRGKISSPRGMQAIVGLSLLYKVDQVSDYSWS